MVKVNKRLLVILASLFSLILIASPKVFAATSPSLGSVGSYSVLGHTTVTNTGATTMPGDLGVSIGGAPVGFPPGIVGPPGTIRNAGDSLIAQNANTAAFGSIDQGCDTTYPGIKDLVAENLVPGVYCADAFQISGTLTLSGTSSDVWIFKSASTLITSGTANVVGGSACNVWWRVVSSASLGTNTSLTGNILALTSISMQTGASLNGRALAQTGAVTLDSNTISASTCLSAPVLPAATGGGDNNTQTTTNPSSVLAASTIPGLPNTGIAPEGTIVSQSSNVIFVALVTALGVTLYLITKKRAT